MDVGDRLHRLQADLATVCRRVGRDPNSVRILGVTKAQPRASVEAAIATGITDIGENYVQEATTKYADLPPVRKHFIGHLQTNKARAVARIFDVVQSIDRADAGRSLAKAAATLDNRPPDVLVQVNVSPAERYGALPAEAPRLADELRDMGLHVDGVMAIGPVTTDRDAIRRAFEAAARTFDSVGGTTLSMGMSGDWELAVEAGSTMIRMGTALFGARRTP